MGLKIEELRVGNWIEYGYKERVDIDNFMMLACNINQVEPIPLTGEILLKAGFEKEGKSIMSLRINEDTEIQYSVLNTDLIAMIRVDQEGFDHNGNPTNQETFLNIIDSGNTHQLQNIYHALTGTELNIEL